MSLLDLIVTAIALSMDAFAVSIGKGLSTCGVKTRYCLVTGLYFGGFQALMPLLGFLLASTFAGQIQRFDHWIAFAMLGIIGANMLREAIFGQSEQHDASFGPRSMLPLAVATSIDALATGVSFAVTGTNIWHAVGLVGVITFLFSAVGVRIGCAVGSKFEKKAEFLGGCILILMGLKILIEHLSSGT